MRVAREQGRASRASALRRLHPTLSTLACASRPDSDTPGKPHWPTMEPSSALVSLPTSAIMHDVHARPSRLCVTTSLHARLLGGASIRIPSVPSARREGTVGVVGCRGARRRSVVAAAVLVEHKFLHERALGAHVHTQAVRQGVQHRAKGGLARGHVDVHSFPVEHVQ